jgi:hypothetical protein
MILVETQIAREIAFPPSSTRSPRKFDYAHALGGPECDVVCVQLELCCRASGSPVQQGKQERELRRDSGMHRGIEVRPSVAKTRKKRRASSSQLERTAVYIDPVG